MAVPTVNTGNTTSFKLVFPLLPQTETLYDQTNFSIGLIDTVLPSITLTEIEVPWLGGNVYYDGGGISYGGWAVNFIVDENWSNYSIIYDWIMSIYDGYNRFGKDWKEYQVNASLIILDNYESNEIISFNFQRLWPKALGEVTLSYREGDEILTCGVEFVYDYFIKS